MNFSILRTEIKTIRYIYLIWQANSISQTLSFLDFGTNYCNLFNLMDGSGLTADPGYLEETSDKICTQYTEADCDIYRAIMKK